MQQNESLPYLTSIKRTYKEEWDSLTTIKIVSVKKYCSKGYSVNRFYKPISTLKNL
jgi:hypothetical protein